MTRRVIAAVLLASSLSVPVAQSAASKPRSEELGYVDDSGIHLFWGETWQDAQRTVRSAADARRREYEHCMHPSDGAGLRSALGIAGDLLQGRRFDPRRLAPPRTPARPRGNCGAPPTNATMTNQVLIVDAAGASAGRPSPLLRMTFRNPDDNLVPGSNQLGNRCVALSDASGQLIPVRSASDPDPYGFANPVGPDPVLVLEKRVASLRDQIAARDATVNSARSGLANASSYDARSGACGMPARAPLPPRPASMSDAEIEDQAAGACVDLMTRRHDPAKVIGALRAVRWDSMIASAQRYQKHPAACASTMTPQMNDVAIRMVCAYSDIACFGQIQTNIQQCIVAARNSCGSPLMAWRREVDALNAAPAAEHAQCLAQQNSLVSARRDVAALRGDLAAAEADLANARQSTRARRSAPLSQARCGG